MQMFSFLYKTILDALFPISEAENETLSMSPEAALRELPAAPDYSGLVVDLPNTWSIFAYKDERVQKLVWSIKYKRSAAAVKIGGYALWNMLQEISAEINQADTNHAPIIVLPMPITSRRRKERGYNQCELLVDEIERIQNGSDTQNGESGSQKFIFEKDLLIRTHHASRQTLKSREERIESAQGIFSVNKKDNKNIVNFSTEQKIVIIDDVITTGSTLHAAIETMKKAGFTRIYALSLAH